MGRSFGLAPCVSETGQRGTQSHSAAGRTLNRFLELESGEHRFYTNNMTEKGTPLLFFLQFIYSMLFSIAYVLKKNLLLVFVLVKEYNLNKIIKNEKGGRSGLTRHLYLF